jgi:hypothetical protein
MDAAVLPPLSACSTATTTIPAVLAVPGEAGWRFGQVEGIAACAGNMRFAPSSTKLSFCAYA